MLVKIKHLHPTQLSVGYEQVYEKLKHIKNIKKDKLEDFLIANTVPIILGPNNSMFIIDRHHFCLAVHKANLDTVHVKIVKDWLYINDLNDFWNLMKESKYIWLYDINGNEISLSEFLSLLPKSIENLHDDPYRSLAGIVRKSGGYKKENEPFSEFHWANFFRSKIPNISLTKDIIDYAIFLSSTEEAKHLPGFLKS